MAKSLGFSKLTQTPGNAIFMPPEAVSSVPQYGISIDVFSFACVCVHLISMQWPVPKDKVVRTNVTRTEVERREHYFAKFAEMKRLKDLVTKCLNDEPQNRPTIEEVSKTVDYSHENDNAIDLFNDVIYCDKIVQKGKSTTVSIF